jgi:hypothetical protein
VRLLVWRWEYVARRDRRYSKIGITMAIGCARYGVDCRVTEAQIDGLAERRRTAAGTGRDESESRGRREADSLHQRNERMCSERVSAAKALQIVEMRTCERFLVLSFKIRGQGWPV